MKRYKDLFSRNNRQHRVIDRPTALKDIKFEDLYVEISDHWQDKAKRLQARRWRQLKNQLT